MENTTTWLLIADASKARLYSIHKAKLFQDQSPKNLKLIQEFDHEESRKKGSELIADKWGEMGWGKTFSETTSPKLHEAEIFALQLLHQLESGRIEKIFRDIIIVAPAAFMGLLLKHMPHEINKLVSQRIEKDYTYQTGQELVQNLLHYF